MAWVQPTYEIVKMDAEIGGYQEDVPVLPSRPQQPVAQDAANAPAADAE